MSNNIQNIFENTHLSSDGSLLNISVGTVGGALSGTISINDWRDCKCRSTSSAVMCPSEIIIGIFAFIACAVRAFFDAAVVFFLFGGFKFLPLLIVAFSTFFRFGPSLRESSSEDSVSSLSDDVMSGFSYCSRRSMRNDRSRVTFSKRRWLDRRASWKNSFSWQNETGILVNNL